MPYLSLSLSLPLVYTTTLTQHLPPHTFTATTSRPSLLCCLAVWLTCWLYPCPCECARQSTPQLDGAFEYLKKVGGETLDTAAFEESAGVGVVVSCRCAINTHSQPTRAHMQSTHTSRASYCAVGAKGSRLYPPQSAAVIPCACCSSAVCCVICVPHIICMLLLCVLHLTHSISLSVMSPPTLSPTKSHTHVLYCCAVYRCAVYRCR